MRRCTSCTFRDHPMAMGIQSQQCTVSRCRAGATAGGAAESLYIYIYMYTYFLLVSRHTYNSI